MPTLENRILTTHAGSLPRPPELAAINKQVDAGIDIVNNEQRPAIAREFLYLCAASDERVFGQESAPVNA